MSAQKADYPSRPAPERIKKPSKGMNKPSRTHGGGKRKTWVSDGSNFNGQMDMSPRRHDAWYKSPYMRQQRDLRHG